MTVRAFNKVTKAWASTEDGSDLSPVDQWVVNPTFVPDEETCVRHGQEFWSYPAGTSIIQTLTEEQYHATMLATMREKKWKEIQAERDRRKHNGVKVGNYWFHSDDSSRIQQLGLVLMGASLPAGIMWKTMSGEFTQMTPILAQQIFQATGAQDIMLFAVAEQKRAHVMTLENPCDYDALAGWPPTFGE
jgi:hypothetical protein